MSVERNEEVRQGEQTARPDASVDRDVFLEFLIGAVESVEKTEPVPEEERGFDITLTVGGILISGRVISRDAFVSGEPFVKSTIGVVDEQRTPEQKEDAEQVLKTGRRHFIHLKDAVFFTGPNLPIPGVGQGFYWRGRLNSVDGWMIGRLTVQSAKS